MKGTTPAGTVQASPEPGAWDQMRALVADCREGLARLGDVVPVVCGAELESFLADLGELGLAVDAAEVTVTAEALTQGRHLAGPAPQPPAQWVAGTSRRYAAGPAASRLVTLAEAVSPATTTRRAGVLAAGSPGELLGAGILDGSIPLAGAAVALTEMIRLVPDLQPDPIPQIWAGYATIAATGDLTQVRRFRQAIYARFGLPERHLKDSESAHLHAALSAAVVAGDGLCEYRMLLDAAGAATLEAALDPLTAPVVGPDGGPDQRRYPTRRAHGLIELIRRAVAAGETLPAQPATQLNISVSLEELTSGIGAATCIGGLDAGRFLTRPALDQLACDAALTTILRDAHGNIHGVGRTRRLFTRDQIRALHARDENCTFPGCTRPAGWSDAHHLVHWIDGGETNLNNAALLCNFHHHTVHARRLAGEVTTGPPGIEDEQRLRVTWNLTRGSYDQLLKHRANPSRE